MVFISSRSTSFTILWLSFNILESSHGYLVSGFDSSSSDDFGSSSQRIREKRYLIYPDGAPSRSQFIIGLGIPTESGEQAVTIGVVIKFQYDLPLNSTQYTDRIFQYAQLVSSRSRTNDEKSLGIETREHNYMKHNFKTIETPEDGNDYNAASYAIDSGTTESDMDTNLVEILNSDLNDNTMDDENQHNKIERSILNFKNDESLKGLSLQEAIEGQERKDALSRDKEASSKKINRWDLYKIIEYLARRYNMGGRACMLRTICEAAETPFTHLNGLFGEIIHILLTLILTIVCLDQIFCGIVSLEEDPGLLQSRDKRQIPLVYPYGGTSKLVLIISVPVENANKIPLAFGANFQYQYTEIQNITQVSPYFTYQTIASRRRKSLEQLEERENERFLFYRGTEEILNMHGLDGKTCMLRAICESAQVPLYEEGLVGEILHVLLTPLYGKDSRTDSVDPLSWLEEYGAAQRAGEQMFDCASVYGHCARGQSILDFISQLHHF